MSIIGLILILLLIGILLWWINRSPILDATIKSIIIWVAILLVIIWLIYLFAPGVGNIRIGR